RNSGSAHLPAGRAAGAALASLTRFRVFRDELTQRCLDFLFAILAQDRQSRFSSRAETGDVIAKGVGIGNRRVVDRGDDVAATNSSAFGGAARPHRADDDTLRFRHPETLSDIRSHALDSDTQLSAPYFSALSDLVGSTAHHVRRNREAHSDVAT